VSMLEKLVKDKFLRKAIFSNEAAFHFSRKVNEVFTLAGQNTLMLQWDTLETTAKLMCGVACCIIFESCQSNCDISQLLGCAENFYPCVITRSAACCILPARRRITTPDLVCTFLNQHVAIVHASLNVSQSNGLVILVPSFNHQITKYRILRFFPVGIHKGLHVPDSGGQHKKFEKQT